MFYRSDNRTPDQMRPVNILPGYINTAEGSVLIEVGNTRVICTASIEETVPPSIPTTGKGWTTPKHRILHPPPPPARSHQGTLQRPHPRNSAPHRTLSARRR